MKGVELPINILVVIAVAVIVLLGVIALYFGGFTGPAQTFGSEGAKGKYCGELMKNVAGCSTVDPAGITINDFDADKDGTVDSGNLWCYAAGDPVGCAVASTCDVAGAADSQDNLASLASCHYGASDRTSVRKVCGCPA